MSTVTLALSTALVDFLWQGALVGAALWISLAGMRRSSAQARYVVSCLALAGLALLPLLTIATLAMSVAGQAPTAMELSSPPAPSPMPQTLLQIWLVPEAPRIGWLAVVQRWALPFWSAGVLLFSARFAYGYAHLFALRRGAASSDDSVVGMVTGLAERMGIARPVRVLVSTVSDGPSVVGWLRPAILLPPATAMGLTPQQLEAVLAHELAHIKRHDYLVNLLQTVVDAVLLPSRSLVDVEAHPHRAGAVLR